ncbi:MAG: hypothetical protein Q4E41_05100 [Bacteroidales bacterium]|nr:hypothetical protein [Bacteroidales bacterium]
MSCPLRQSTVAEDQFFECNCPKECPRHGKCCACVANHHSRGSLPFCMRNLNSSTDKGNANAHTT